MFWPDKNPSDILEQLQKVWNKPNYSVTTKISLDIEKGYELILKIDTEDPYFIILNGKEELFRTIYMREAIKRFDEIIDMVR